MPTVASILATLKSKGREQTRKIYSKHGMAPELLYGVSVADMKEIAKTIRGDQALACDLLSTGKMEAMYLAGLVADGAQVTGAQLTAWIEASDQLQMITEYTIPWLATENPQARTLAKSWIKSKKEHVVAAGWSTYTGLIATQPDDKLDLAEIEELLRHVVQKIATAPNRVRAAMNVFVISVGSYVKPLLKQAKQAAHDIGAVEVDVGETACKIPSAVAYIEKVEKAGRIGKKRKTMRC